jgi:hypothetical protein
MNRIFQYLMEGFAECARLENPCPLEYLVRTETAPENPEPSQSSTQAVTPKTEDITPQR